MSDDEGRGISEKNGNRGVILKHGNYTSWMHYITNRIKGLKSPELEAMITFGTMPIWRTPAFYSSISE